MSECGLYVRHVYVYTHTNSECYPQKLCSVYRKIMYIRTDRQTDRETDRQTDLLSVLLSLNRIHSRARLGLHGDLKLGILAEATGVAQEGILFIIVDCPGEDERTDRGKEGRRKGGN